MNLDQMLKALETLPGRQVKLTPQQKDVIKHATGPLWVIAGPGSGKTEVLVLRCLKLICIDGQAPASVMVTTFTERAARNIQDRLAIYKEHLTLTEPSLKDIDLALVRIGTLHSLCNDIMQEYRYPAYQNVRLLDGPEQTLFVYEHAELAGFNPPSAQLALWQQLRYLLEGYDPISKSKWTGSTMPSRWRRARACVTLFNRIVDDLIDVKAMAAGSSEWQMLAHGYEQYARALDQHYRCDFAHVQKRFHEFLDTPRGAQFLQGDGGGQHAGLAHVLVDEYQDTNPIQEAIYLKLCSKSPHNVTVVGDDDQALYRFRGGTVECMVTFDKACQRAWKLKSTIAQKPLMDNFRSHKKVVEWCNEYIDSFALMHQPGARAPGKPQLHAKSGISGSHDAVALLTRRNVDQLANAFGDMVQGLLQHNIVQHPSQCVLLMKSTRENNKWAGPYVDALRQRNIPTYNPRSKALLQQEEVVAALGGLVEVLDPQHKAQNAVRGDGIQSIADEWRAGFNNLVPAYPALDDYVNHARKRIAAVPAGELIMLSGAKGKPINFPATLQEMFYHLLNHEPFKEWMEDPERTVRLGALTKALEAYCSTPAPGKDAPTKGYLRTSSTAAGEISFQWRQNFYYALVGLLVSEGLDEPEDDEELFPKDRLPIMTVHQVKGLEFPFVFVGGPSEDAQPSSSHLLEDDFSHFRRVPSLASKFTAQQRALQDLARFYYVAYSRAQYALIMMGTTSQIAQQRPATGGQTAAWFRQRVPIL